LFVITKFLQREFRPKVCAHVSAQEITLGGTTFLAI
jgi:hypothetical protein